MTCDLNDEELFILNLLYKNRCLRSNRGYNLKKIASLFRRKFDKDCKKVLKNLINEGYLSAIGKNPPKYYITDKPGTFFALDQHGFIVSKGRERPL